MNRICCTSIESPAARRRVDGLLLGAEQPPSHEEQAKGEIMSCAYSVQTTQRARPAAGPTSSLQSALARPWAHRPRPPENGPSAPTGARSLGPAGGGRVCSGGGDGGQGGPLQALGWPSSTEGTEMDPGSASLHLPLPALVAESLRCADAAQPRMSAEVLGGAGRRREPWLHALDAWMLAASDSGAWPLMRNLYGRLPVAPPPPCRFLIWHERTLMSLSTVRIAQDPGQGACLITGPSRDARQSRTKGTRGGGEWVRWACG